MNEIISKAEQWLSPVFDTETNRKTQNLIDTDSSELEDCFYKDLTFGTGGMRGIMGVGTNRINKYTLGKNTQGISNYLKKSFPSEELKVAIAYDCRHNSKELAQITANVFSANGIKVFLFSDLRPTPELSFAVKYLNCHCGIVLTASHNPPEYNGYKVYWQDGGQLVPPQDTEIITEISQLDFSEINFNADKNLIQFIDQEIDEAFLEASLKNGSFTEGTVRENLNIVFTSLHGTSITMVPKVLEKAGYSQVNLVKEQAEPNGDFPTVKSPNPEEPEALKMALELAKDKNADIVIGTDPDCDRLGIAVRNLNNELILLNGNQTMIVMTWFLLEQRKKPRPNLPSGTGGVGKIKGKEFVASTIVSTPMMRVLAENYGVEYKEGLTGFKWIAKMIEDFPELDFIGGGEESYGFMVGDFVRDKDAVTSTLLICEIAAQLKAEGSSIYQKLLELYVEFGFYKESLVSMVKKGKDGAEEIEKIMIGLRENPLHEIDGEKTVLVEDYQNSIFQRLLNFEKGDLLLPKSNVLIYYTEEGTKIAARPSGTEPKIKFYISVNTELDSIGNFEEADQKLTEKIERIKKELNL
ncbi:MAG TPA: phospho-sugar mutase [Flavobacteriaceae bacterium]|nr:phospho-sugar mutase [Flavobacteriaceae bacterium]